MADVGRLILVVSTLFSTQIFADQPFTRTLETKILCPLDSACSALKENASYINVAYTKALGHDDTVHYVYTSFGAPTVFVAKTSRNSALNFNLSRFVSENETERSMSLKFTGGAPDATLALVFTELIEFNDIDDSGQMPSNRTLWHRHNLSSGIWEDSSNSSDAKNNVVEFRMILPENSSTPLNQSGNIVFRFQAFADDGKNSHLPHLHYNANITQVYVSLENLATRFPNPRFALAMVAVRLNNSVNMTINDVKSIDDETTPGAFHTMNWITPSSPNDVFLQWKPLCYTEQKMQISNARYTYHRGPQKEKLHEGANLVEAYFGSLEKISGEETIVSFGETDDKFYTATHFTVWALTVGYGTPPVEAISLLVILIISIGLGIPVVLILIGGFYVVIQRYRRRRSTGYADLTSSYPPIGT